MPQPPQPATPASAQAPFMRVDTLGHEVSLRRPEPGEFLCGGCLAEALGELSGTDLRRALAEAFSDELGPLLAGCHSPTGEPDAGGAEEAVLAALYPAPGQPGHDCGSEVVGPLWLVREPDCALDARGHLGASPSPECRCGVASLLEVLEYLDAADRQAALEAHIAALHAGYDHLRAAEALAAPGDAGAALTYLPAACITCLADPAFHLEEIDEDLTARTLELAPVLRAFSTRVSLGPRRPPGPLTSEQP